MSQQGESDQLRRATNQTLEKEKNEQEGEENVDNNREVTPLDNKGQHATRPSTPAKTGLVGQQGESVQPRSRGLQQTLEDEHTRNETEQTRDGSVDTNKEVAFLDRVGLSPSRP